MSPIIARAAGFMMSDGFTEATRQLLTGEHPTSRVFGIHSVTTLDYRNCQASWWEVSSPASANPDKSTFLP